METTRTPAHHTEKQRYVHDIAQAEAMRRRTSSTTNKKTTTKPATGTSTTEALSLGLRGLDEADVLREGGHSRCALDLYQSAIEVLIRLLQQDSTASYDKTALEERVRVALSDAERLKEQLKAQQQHAAEPTSESPIRKTCYTLITQYLAGVRGPKQTGKNIPSPTTTTRPTPPPQQQTSPSNRTVSTVHTARSNQSAASQQSTTTRRPAAAPASEHAKLEQSVLEDMYVPASQLQSTTWSDVAGLATAKQALQEAAIMPLVRPDLYTGLRKPQNILLYGPPGTGKTMLVKAVAYESKCTLFAVAASAITSKWLGDGEKLCRALFALAQQYAPSIVFFDEIDSIASTRKSDGENEASRRLKTELMTRMDGINSAQGSVLVIACTNCPWDVDSAILRRLSRRIFVPLPDKDARKALLKNLLAKAGKHSITGDQRSAIVKRLKGFSGSDIQAIASEASFGPLRSVGSLDEIRSVRAKDVRPIAVEDFDNAIDQATKSVSKQQLNRYDEWKKQQGV